MCKVRRFLVTAITLPICIYGAAVGAQPPGNIGVIHWNEGSKHCSAASQPPLQVNAYNAQTFILRQNPCASFEANFLYLLIDTGALKDAKAAPLLNTVLDLLPRQGSDRLPLLVVHTHKHLDHRSGDSLFQAAPGVGLVQADLASVKSFFGFTQWPQGAASLDLGGRVVDVIPAPGHQNCEIVFYDRNSALLFSGDFLMPGRLLIENKQTFLESASRIGRFLADRPLTGIYGGHIELSKTGKLYRFGSHYHPNEHSLELHREDLANVVEALEHFNGWYQDQPNFVLFSARLEFALALEKGL